MSQALKTFICYAHEDHEIVEGLKKQLAIFEKRQLLQIWSDGKILAGEHWDKSIKTQLERAEIILLFVSVDFINSEYIEKTELQAALQRHRDGEATLIPIIVRPCHWQSYFDIGQFQALPAKARPILSSHFPHRDEALFEIATGIKEKAEELYAKKLAVAARAEAEAAAQKEAAEKTAQQAATAERQRIKDEAAWKAAVKLSTLEAYEDYLEKAYTLHKAKAQQRIEEIEEAETARRVEQRAKEKEAARLAALAAEKEAEAQRAKEAEKKKKEEAARKKREQEAAEARAREKAERDADRFLQNDKKADPFHDLMVQIKGGTFDMGSNKYDDEKPIHKVTVPDFHLCKYPVTQAQWKQIMGDNPSHFKGDDLPVERVSWDDAQVFLKKLNEKTDKQYRLPTEAEWEYAARGGNQSKGYEYAGSNDLKDVGWFWENSGDKPLSGSWSVDEVTKNNCRTHPVGQKKANELGLHDMSGNVWEWCQDSWHKDYEGAPDDGSAWIDDAANTAVLRGGSWLFNDNNSRVARRNWYDRNLRYYYIGLRLARAASEGGA